MAESQIGYLISIHAPHTGSDWMHEESKAGNTAFQSTLLILGATSVKNASILGKRIFQSTLPIRGATKKIIPDEISLAYFNPRSPYGERPFWSGMRFPR